jgi:ribosome-associated protein
MARRPAPHRGIDTERPEPADGEGPSKTALKQQSHALQTLGLQLAELPEQRLAATPMPDALRRAIEEWRRTRSHEGRRRQMQYIGKLMRSADEAPLREAVAAAALGSAYDALALHEAEAWRAQLIADDGALERWLAAHPQCEVQQLRSLIRAARRDGAGHTPEQRQPRSFRELFQFLRPHLSPQGPAASSPPPVGVEETRDGPAYPLQP